jgi:glycosyltransferase involved in cell wall biosynthesis
MWSTEPHLYGAYPYPGVRKPKPSDHVHYIVTTEWMRTRMRAWAPSSTCHVVPYRFFSPVTSSAPRTRLQPARRSLRSVYGIPENARLVVRCTRVVPQKSIDRDLRLLDEVQRRLADAGDTRKVFLLVTGPTRENPDEYARLRALEQQLSIAGQVIWADGMPRTSLRMNGEVRDEDPFSIDDVLANADLSSFLTTYDYEGFGMPPGEAMAAGVPFIVTTYELYHEVYGNKSAIAPLLAIDHNSRSDDPIPKTFVDWTIRVLTDESYRHDVRERNLQVVERFFSMEALERQLHELFDGEPSLR